MSATLHHAITNVMYMKYRSVIYKIPQYLLLVPVAAFTYTNVFALRRIDGRSMEPTLNKSSDDDAQSSWIHSLPYILQQDIAIEISAPLHKLYCFLRQQPYLLKGYVITLWYCVKHLK